jgi:hypothetical protein
MGVSSTAVVQIMDIVGKRQMERYREALDQKGSAIFCRERACYLSERRPGLSGVCS